MDKIWQIYRLHLYSIYAEKGEIIMWAINGAAVGSVSALPWLLLGTIQSDINGRPIQAIAMYYLITFLMWYVSGGAFGWGISNLIKNGELTNYLTRPYFPLAYPIIGEQGWKTLGLLISLPIFLVIIYFTIGLNLSFITAQNIVNWLLLIPATIMIFGFLEFIKGISSFWFIKVDGVFNLFDMFALLFGGLIAPLYLLPNWLQAISKYLPFQYIFGFPNAVVTGQIADNTFLNGIIASYIWVFILFIIATVLYKFGIKKYESIGN